MNSKQKGKRGELEFARLMRSHGIDARRGVQYKGGEDSPDVVGVPFLHCEVKRVEKLNIYDAIAQAVRDSGTEELPVVFHRKNNCEWLTTMRTEDFMTIYKEFMCSKLGDADNERERKD